MTALKLLLLLLLRLRAALLMLLPPRDALALRRAAGMVDVVGDDNVGEKKKGEEKRREALGRPKADFVLFARFRSK